MLYTPSGQGRARTCRDAGSFVSCSQTGRERRVYRNKTRERPSRWFVFSNGDTMEAIIRRIAGTER